MKTQRKYYENTFLYESTATVTMTGVDAKGSFVRLDETIFHPQGGGQPSDEGSINGISVIKVTLAPDDREEINHWLPPNHSLKVGDGVSLQVDREKRLHFAALHTGGHMLANVLRNLGLLSQNNLNTVKSHHFPNEAYFQVKPDVTVPPVDALKESICDGMKQMIAEKRPIQVSCQEGVRRMSVEGYPEDPCGGTHLSSTAEVGHFSIRGIKNNKEGVRVGYDALCTRP